MKSMTKEDRKKVIARQVKSHKMSAALKARWREKKRQLQQDAGEVVDTTIEHAGHADYDIREVESMMRGAED